MEKKVIFVLIATVLIFALGTQTGFSKDNEKEKAESDTTGIVQKLDEVLANQAEILKQFDEIKQELAIIKVRASHR